MKYIEMIETVKIGDFVKFEYWGAGYLYECCMSCDSPIGFRLLQVEEMSRTDFVYDFGIDEIAEMDFEIYDKRYLAYKDGYLNYDEKCNKLITCGNTEEWEDGFRTMFTKKEIKKLEEKFNVNLSDYALELITDCDEYYKGCQ